MTNKKSKPISKKLIDEALASGQITFSDPKAKHRKGYELRVASGFKVKNPIPGFADHPSREGVIDSPKSVLLGDADTIWTAVTREHYAQGGIEKWIVDSLTPLAISIYWQMVHFQMVWGGRANPSFKTLSRNLGVNYRSVQRSVHNLLDIGAIELVRKHSGRAPAVYRVVLLSSLEKADSVEATIESVEASDEVRTGDSPDTQKTKPHKGRVAHSPAGAGRATPRKSKPIVLRTIDEERDFQSKQRAKSQRVPRPVLIRPFFPAEVRKEKIDEILTFEFLAKKWEEILKVYQETTELLMEEKKLLTEEEFEEDHLIERDVKTLMKEVQSFLTQQKLDVSNLPKALEVTLNHLLKVAKDTKINFERSLKATKERQQREERLREAQELEETNRLQKIALSESERIELLKAEYANVFQYLTKARELFQVIFPDLDILLNNWGGGVGLLYALEGGGKESQKIADLSTRKMVQDVTSQVQSQLETLFQIRNDGNGREGESSKEEITESWAVGGEGWNETFGSLILKVGGG